MERIKSEIKNLIDEWRWHCSAEAKYRCEAYGELLDFINSLQEEPVSEDLEEAANDYVGHAPEIDEDLSCFTKRNAFIAGARWQKEHLMYKACSFLRSYQEYQNHDIATDSLIEAFKMYIEL